MFKPKVQQFFPSIAVLAIVLSLGFHGAFATATVNITVVGPVRADPNTIKFPGGPAYNFRPAVAMVVQGGAVVWMNSGNGEPHTVTSYTDKAPIAIEGFVVQMPVPDSKFDSLSTMGPINPGSSYTLNTANLPPGDYHYFCQFHPWMQAVLHVNAPSTSAKSQTTMIRMDHTLGQTSQFFAGSAGWGFLPRDITVKKGTQVVVTNTAVIPHTFTSYTDTMQVPVDGRVLSFPIPDGTFDSLTTNPDGIQTNTSYTLDTSTLNPGTYHFFCDFHDWMLGTLTVTG